MNISIIGRQMNVDTDLKARVEKKLAKFDKFFPDGADAFVTFSRIRENECLEITISYKGTLFRSEEKDSTFICALDECVENIERQIRKNKTRIERRLKDATLNIPAPSDGGEPIEEEGDFTIRTKSFSLKPMSPEEAILQMNLLGHSFFVFTDSETEETCVVYRRKLRNDRSGKGLIDIGAAARRQPRFLFILHPLLCHHPFFLQRVKSFS